MATHIWLVLTDVTGETHYIPYEAISRFSVVPPGSLPDRPDEVTTAISLHGNEAIYLDGLPEQVYGQLLPQFTAAGETMVPVFWPPVE